jgi:hypothetical protein
VSTEFIPGSKHWLRVRLGTYGRTQIVQDTVVKVTPKRIYWECYGQTDHAGFRRYEVQLATEEDVRRRKEDEALAQLDAIVHTRLNMKRVGRDFAALIAMARAGGADVPEWILEVTP